MPQTEIRNKQILIFGHSHLNALQRAYRLMAPGRHDSSAKPPFTVTFISLHDEIFQPNLMKEGTARKLHRMIETQFSALVHRDNPSLVVSCAMGNEYNVFAMLNHPRRFDFYLPSRPDLVTDETAEILPVSQVESLITARLENTLGQYLAMMSRAVGRKLIHIPPPPPIFERAYIEQYPGVFGEKAKRLGVSPAIFRLKMWLLTCEVQEALCRKSGVALYSLPPVIFDESGFLALQFRNEDPTHGNSDYGRVILNDIASRSFP